MLLVGSELRNSGMMNFNEIMWIAEQPPRADNEVSYSGSVLSC